MASLAGLRLFEAPTAHPAEAVKMLDRWRGASLSYVDASSLALIERHKLREVWATDHHLALTGATVLPH